MPRLRNVSTGAVVNVSAETASRLGSAWVPVEPSKPAPKPRAGGRGKSKAK